MSWGYALCRHDELSEVIKAYVARLDEKHLRPIWLNVDARTGKVPADELGWRALSVTADLSIRCDDPVSQGNKNVHRKVRAAKREGMIFQFIKGEIKAQLRQEIDEGIQEWRTSRSGTKVNTTKIRPWADSQQSPVFHWAG